MRNLRLFECVADMGFNTARAQKRFSKLVRGFRVRKMCLQEARESAAQIVYCNHAIVRGSSTVEGIRLLSTTVADQ